MCRHCREARDCKPPDPESISLRPKPQTLQFGARLMHKPETVKQCVHAMARAAGNVPVTVKCRLGTNQVQSPTDETYAPEHTRSSLHTANPTSPLSKT